MEQLRAVTIKKKHTAQYYNFTDLVDEYGDSLYKFCRSLTFSKEDADDLFQETFLKAMERQGRLAAFDSPKGFLFSTSLFIWKSWKRKYARRKRLLPTESLDESTESDHHRYEDNDSSIEAEFILQEEIALVRKIVKDLPDKFRFPIILHYTSGLGVTEIAEIMKIPSGTVKSRLFKARKLIEKGLGAKQYEK